MANDLKNGASSYSKGRDLDNSLTHQSMENVVQDDWNHEGIDEVTLFIKAAQPPGD